MAFWESRTTKDLKTLMALGDDPQKIQAWRQYHQDHLYLRIGKMIATFIVVLVIIFSAVGITNRLNPAPPKCPDGQTMVHVAAGNGTDFCSTYQIVTNVDAPN